MSRVLGPPHEDPADRFLAATAKVLEFTLVTADGRLAGSREFAVLPKLTPRAACGLRRDGRGRKR